MLAKIKKRIIFATLASVFIVLVGIMFVLNLINYTNIVSDADSILKVLIENNGAFPVNIVFHNAEETPFETRFFTVILNDDNEITDINLSSIAAVNEESAVALAEKADDERGFIGEFRYKKKQLENGASMIVFMDCHRNLDVFYDTLRTSIIGSLLGFLLVILLSFFLSQEAVKVYEISDKRQKQFIADAGHEIKTPIAIINADIQALEMDYGKNEWCDDVLAQTGRLARLTADLITLARMEDTLNKGEIKDINITEVLINSARSFRSLALSNKKEYRYDIADNLSLRGKTKDIKELVDILLDNAIKYSDEKGNILFSAAKTGTNVVLAISNSVNEDVNKDIVKYMFDRFYRGDESHNSGQQGIGIGLAVAKAICERYHGNIKSEIKENKMIITATLKGASVTP